jgi:predicted HicB family RNase H-like nuclease
MRDYRVMMDMVEKTQENIDWELEESEEELEENYQTEKEKPIEKNIRQLSEYYPDKNVVGLRSMDNNLYQKLVLMAKNRKVSLSDFLEQFGFLYTPNIKHNDIVGELLVQYPDKVVHGLLTNNKRLHGAVVKASGEQGISIEEYLRLNGFDYVRESTIKTPKKIEQYLLKEYPNKIVTGLQTRNKTMYSRILIYAKKEGLSVREYLANLGFAYATAKK